MTTDRHKINIHVINIDWYFANSLCSICMKKNFLLSVTLRKTSRIKKIINKIIIMY